MSEKSVRVGMMPGKITEVVVSIGTSIRDAIAVAELDPSGYTVKVDGVQCDNIDGTYVSAGTNLILLVKQVKGN